MQSTGRCEDCGRRLHIQAYLMPSGGSIAYAESVDANGRRMVWCRKCTEKAYAQK